MFATGVTVIAAGQEQYLHVMTANAVTSLSLDPMLMLFCVRKEARMVTHLAEHPQFTVNILRASQADLSPYFAGMWKGEEPPHFEFAIWHNAARLKDCAASICCEVHQMAEAGDHTIVIGRVVALWEGKEPADPLIFYAGKYRQLVEE
jgi:flavin reductase (DIM6/NTAB) family NADH-FMN oxidoreductase RutF